MPIITQKARARQDLIDIGLYIAESSGDLDTARNFLKTIIGKFEMLAQHPLMGKSRSSLAPNLRSFPVGRYLIFYVPLSDGIGIVRVLFGGRNLQALDFDEDETL